MSKILIVILSLALFTSCLRNLNVTEFFRKLEIKAPEYFEKINGDRAVYEEKIKELIEDYTGRKVESITYWGEGRYACGNVITKIDGEKYVVVLGKYKLEQDVSKSYYVVFKPGEAGEVINPILSR